MWCWHFHFGLHISVTVCCQYEKIAFASKLIKFYEYREWKTPSYLFILCTKFWGISYQEAIIFLTRQDLFYTFNKIKLEIWCSTLHCKIFGFGVLKYNVMLLSVIVFTFVLPFSCQISCSLFPRLSLVSFSIAPITSFSLHLPQVQTQEGEVSRYISGNQKVHCNFNHVV